MNKPTIDHVLVTRFNVPTPGREGYIRAQEGWLKNRIELFEQFCAPSIDAQSLQSFHWLVYFDPDSPQWFLEWLESAQAPRRFTAIFRTSVSRDELVHDLKQITGGRGNILLTTNLDNDDGLAVDFVQRLQSSVRTAQRTAHYLSCGIILRDGQTFLQHDARNAFCSVSEGWDAPVTAWADWHNRLELSMPVQVHTGAPAWLQVIHGRNVSNSVHGRLCNPSDYADLFPAALAGLPAPSTSLLAVERFALAPARAGRAAVRRAIKSLLLGTMGARGLDAAKNRFATFAARTGNVVSPSKNPRWSQQRIESEE